MSIRRIVIASLGREWMPFLRAFIPGARKGRVPTFWVDGVPPGFFRPAPIFTRLRGSSALLIIIIIIDGRIVDRQRPDVRGLDISILTSARLRDLPFAFGYRCT